MPTDTLVPASTGTYTVWTPTGGTRPGVVQTNDADTTYINMPSATGTGRDSYVMPDIPSAAIVSAVVGYSVHRRTGAGAGTQTLMTRWSATDDDYGSFSPDITYTTHNAGLSAPTGSGGWSGTVWNATEFGINASVGAASDIRCTHLYVSITYKVPSSFFLFMGSVMLPVIGSLVDSAQFRSYLDWHRAHSRRRTQWTPSEAKELWGAHKAYRWPSYHLIG